MALNVAKNLRTVGKALLFSVVCANKLSQLVQTATNEAQLVTLLRHPEQISPPPMTTASYWDLGAAWLDLHLLADPKTAADLRARVLHTNAAAMTRGSAAPRRL